MMSTVAPNSGSDAEINEPHLGKSGVECDYCNASTNDYDCGGDDEDSDNGDWVL
jgi:hypothetical protein